ncbi:MAG: hypothetical protein ACXVJD_17780 [Mucilaginibacter sp.]
MASGSAAVASSQLSPERMMNAPSLTSASYSVAGSSKSSSSALSRCARASARMRSISGGG